MCSCDTPVLIDYKTLFNVMLRISSVLFDLETVIANIPQIAPLCDKV